jgi:hypothetical protein
MRGGCDLRTVFRIRIGPGADLDPKIICLNTDPDHTESKIFTFILSDILFLLISYLIITGTYLFKKK